MVRIYSEFEVSIRELAESLEKGGVIGLATDTTYALVAALSSRRGVEKLRELRKVPPSKNLSLLIKDLTQISKFAYIDRIGYRLVKRVTPGHYTFILKATKEVPNRLQHEKRKTIGLRVPDNKVLQSLLTILGEPLLSTSLILPNEKEALLDSEEMIERVSKQVDCIIDGGWLGTEVSTVIDLHEDTPVLVRAGKGAVDF